jgi:demethylmenaquinone methyltransferase/2-methoxy-6-polyprenyl-1,4-benzoquinol methylase
MWPAVPGTQLVLYQEAGCRAFGIDLSPAMLAVAQPKLGLGASLQVGDAARMPYADGAFDLLTAVLLLHEMPAQVRTASVQEFRRVVKPGGRMLIVDHHTGPYPFPRGWLRKLVLTLLEMAGGREHYMNYRDFLARGGLPALIEAQGLAVARIRLVQNGSQVSYLLAQEPVAAGAASCREPC